MKLIERCIPKSSYKFQGKEYKDAKRKGGTYLRYCNRDWLNEFSFLSYSKSRDGLFSLACILFPCASGAQHADILITEPFNKWKKGREALSNHAILKYRMQAECKGIHWYVYRSTKAN